MVDAIKHPVCLLGSNQQREQQRKLVIALTIAVSTLCNPAAQADTLKAKASLYADSREYATLNINLSSDRLPAGFTLWGFTDFHGDQNGNISADFKRTFSEYRLSHNGPSEWLGIKGLGLQAEYNNATPGGGNAYRFGLTYKHPLGKGNWLQWRVLPLQDDKDKHQMSLIYSIGLVSKLRLSGFADYNINDHGKDRWVIEPELSYEIAPRTRLLLEYRLNQFEQAANSKQGVGFALGISYQL